MMEKYNASIAGKVLALYGDVKSVKEIKEMKEL